VYFPIAVVEAIAGNCPSTATLPGSGGFACRSNEYLASAAVTSLPFENLTPFLRVHTIRLGLTTL
jgi:hypothetical protein